VAALVGVAGGVLAALAFPGLGWWPLVFVGVPLILAALVGRSVWASLLIGLVAGFAFWGTLILWLTVYLGPVPWLALAGLEAVFFAVGCLLITLAWRVGDRVALARRSAVSTALVRQGAVPVVVAGLWTLRELVASTWPYGGFSWGRLAFSQSESPLAGLVAWTGVSGLSFLIAWVAALTVQALRIPASARGRTAATATKATAAAAAATGTPGRRGLVAARALPAVLLVGMLAVPAFPVATSGSIRVGAVQGDADAGLFARYQPGEILEDHLDATQEIYGEDVDLVVWPENAADLDPLRVTQSASALDRVTERMDAPLITGTITAVGDRIFNSLLLWESGEGVIDQYDKIHPVPFAEYIPDRDFWYPLAPGLLSLIPRDYTVGTRDNVFDVGGATAGLAICFDIVDDSLVRRMVADGADLIVAPSNNADFGRTDESVQQLAIARLRAIETGRSLVNVSTVGTSAIIAPDGSTLAILPTFEPGTMVEDVPLSTVTTPATAFGRPLELAVSLGGLVGLLLLAVAGRRRRAHPEGTGSVRRDPASASR
jgi:apolipoprotein N-acyltransferase